MPPLSIAKIPPNSNMTDSGIATPSGSNCQTNMLPNDNKAPTIMQENAPFVRHIILLSEPLTSLNLTILNPPQIPPRTTEYQKCRSPANAPKPICEFFRNEKGDYQQSAPNMVKNVYF
jgi:hypothetical protein